MPQYEMVSMVLYHQELIPRYYVDAAASLPFLFILSPIGYATQTIMLLFC